MLMFAIYYLFSSKSINFALLINNLNFYIMKTNKYLIALPCFANSKGFNHPTILVSAHNEIEAVLIARRLRPNCNIGSIKKVDY